MQKVFDKRLLYHKLECCAKSDETQFTFVNKKQNFW